MGKWYLISYELRNIKTKKVEFRYAWNYLASTGEKCQQFIEEKLWEQIARGYALINPKVELMRVPVRAAYGRKHGARLHSVKSY